MTMRRRMKEDNRGIALISVMICVMLSFLLSATIMRISLLSYLQKGIAKQATTTFYENETFVDDIKLGVQQKVAMAFANSTSTSQASFLTNFKTALLAAGTGGTEKAQLESALASFIQNTEALKVVSVTVEGDGGVLFKPEGEGEYVIKNVKIEYVDNTKDGYVSNIKTDIRIKSPFYITVTEESSGGYSMMAANGAVIANGGGENRNQWGNLKQGGNLYFGYEKGTVTAEEVSGKWVVKSASAATLESYMSYWMTGDTVIFNGDLYVKKHSTLIFTGKKLVVRGTIYLNDHSHLVLGTASKVECRDIVLDNHYNLSNMSLAGGESIQGPPIDYVSQYSGRTSWDSYNSSVAVYDGPSDNRTSFAGTSTHRITSKSNIIQNTAIRPVSNVTAAGVPLSTKTALEGNGEQYDKEMSAVLDVPYLKTLSSVPWAFGNKTPKGYITNFTASGANNKGKWSNMSGYYGDTTEFPTLAGKEMGINVGTNIQDVNNKFGYFMLNWKDTNEVQKISINVNTPYDPIFYGMLFSKGKFQITITGANVGLGQSWMEYYENNKTNALAALKKIGQGIVTEGQTPLEKFNINNCFINGILSLLDENSGTGETTVSHDETKNKSVEVVSFENWEKY